MFLSGFWRPKDAHVFSSDATGQQEIGDETTLCLPKANQDGEYGALEMRAGTDGKSASLSKAMCLQPLGVNGDLPGTYGTLIRRSFQ